MSRNKYGAKSLTMRKADSMRNPAYVSIPRMPNGRYEMVLPPKRSSFFKADSMRNPEYIGIKRAPAVERMSDKVRARVNRTIGIDPLGSILDFISGGQYDYNRSQENISDYYTRMARKELENYNRKNRIPAYVSLPKGKKSETRAPLNSYRTAEQERLNSEKAKQDLRTFYLKPRKNTDSMRNPKYIDIERSPAVENTGDKVRAVLNRTIGSDPMRSALNFMTGGQVDKSREYINRKNYEVKQMRKLIAQYNKEKNIPEYIGFNKRAIRKADSMRNPEYIGIKRAPAVERMSDKVRARVNRTIGSNPLESVLEILQGKDTRNMINAQRNRNDYYRRKGDEISANYAREKRIPEYTRLPKGSAVPNMAMRAKEALNRIGAGTPDPAQKLMAILQSPSVIARFFDESQGKGRK